MNDGDQYKPLEYDDFGTPFRRSFKCPTERPISSFERSSTDGEGSSLPTDRRNRRGFSFDGPNHHGACAGDGRGEITDPMSRPSTGKARISGEYRMAHTRRFKATPSG
jgi:hypothetical protein